MSKVEQELAYVLHRRQFRETSVILDVFSRQHGRVDLIAKGVRRAKSPKQALLQPFNALSVSWAGRSDLQTLTKVESALVEDRLLGHYLNCGFYVNELLIKLIHKHDPHPGLFDHYAKLISSLKQKAEVQQVLRQFELFLLKEIGYDISAQQLDDNALYTFSYDSGFMKVHHHAVDIKCFKGADIKRLLDSQSFDEDFAAVAKAIMRMVMQCILQYKTINSRQLFVSEGG